MMTCIDDVHARLKPFIANEIATIRKEMIESSKQNAVPAHGSWVITKLAQNGAGLSTEPKLSEGDSIVDAIATQEHRTLQVAVNHRGALLSVGGEERGALLSVGAEENGKYIKTKCFMLSTCPNLMHHLLVDEDRCTSVAISELKSELKQDMYWLRRETDAEIQTLR